MLPRIASTSTPVVTSSLSYPHSTPGVLSPHPPSHHHPRPGSPHIRALLIDISGTLLVGHTPISNAPHSLTRLRNANVPFRLCTNTSKESNASLVARLSQAGLGDGDGERLGREVWSSIGALGDAMKGLGVKRPYMLLSPSAMEESMPDHITSTNTNTNANSTNPNPNVHRAAATTNPRSTDLTTPSTSSSSSSPKSFHTDPPPPPQSESSRPVEPEKHDAVIVGLAPAMLDYDHLNTAFRILIGERGREGEDQSAQMGDSSESKSDVDVLITSHGRPPLIALHKARYVASSSEDFSGKTQMLSLGPGPFVSALEEAANTKAIVVGKPSRTFFKGSLRDLFPPRDGNGTNGEVEVEGKGKRKGRLDRNEHENEDEDKQWTDVAVIGDDVLADLGEGAIELGMWRVLVKTGKYRPGDECRPGVVPPDQVCESFEAFVDWLLGEGNDGAR